MVYACFYTRQAQSEQGSRSALLRAINISEAAIAPERQAMSQMCYDVTTGTSNGRSVLGTINDYKNVLRCSDRSERSLSDWNLHFSDWLCSPLGYKHPIDVARELLDAVISPQLGL